MGEDIFGEYLPKAIYEKILSCKLTVKSSINIMIVIIKHLAELKKLHMMEEEIEGEAWRILVRSSQKHFPVKHRKGILEKPQFGIRMAVFRLDQDTMLRKYNINFMPIFGKDDPLPLKLTRDSHTEDTLFERVHKPIRASLQDLTIGKYGVLSPEDRSYMKLIHNTCPRCLEQDEFAYEAEFGNVS